MRTKKRSYKRKKRRVTNKKISSRRVTKRRLYKGGNEEKVQCCICDKMVSKDNTLVPRICLSKHMDRAHRVCKDCWWDDFAVEEGSHMCPGCIRGVPLLPKKDYGIIELDD